MSGYVRATKLEEDFQGDKVTGWLQQLSIPDLLRLQSAQVSTDEEAAQVLAEIVPKYVTEFAGLSDASGGEVSIQEVCRTAYFIELAMNIGRKLVSAARPPRQPSETSAS
jgi:hypothetical protein